MKICIPVESNNGLESVVFGHFGSAPYFLVYDTDIKAVGIIENSNKHHSLGACDPLRAIAGKNVQVVIAGGMGNGAVMKLNAGGIKVFKSELLTVSEVVQEYLNGNLKEIGEQGCCAGHGCQGHSH